KFAVHLCRRAGARVRGEKHHAGTYGPILPQLNRLNVQHLTMEFTAAGADDLESLGRLREDFELGLGVVDVTPGAPQTAPMIAARDDVLVPCSMSEQLAASIPGATLDSAPWGAHAINVTEPDAFNAMLLKFLDANS
ncbi:MAG TPA: hypothetical protein VK630_18870, partial [Reyranella sp.]|nr:hypothetical protein [Reyranella sp.]